MKKLDKDINKVQSDYEQKKLATAANYLLGTSTRKGIVNEIDGPFKALEKELNAIGKLPKRLHLKCYELACKIYTDQKPKDAEKIDKWCSATLSIQEDHVDALLSRGEIKLQQNDFEAAVRDLEKANEASNGQNNRVRHMLQRAQQMLRQSKRRDYYKILGWWFFEKIRMGQVRLIYVIRCITGCGQTGNQTSIPEEGTRVASGQISRRSE